MTNQINKIDDVLTRGVEQVIPSRKKLSSLMKKRKIKLYQGFDPSMPSLHLGNLVGLIKLKQFQELGHEVIFLVGDFTGMIGDPTDKLSTRKKLARKQVLENAKTWKKQAAKVINFEGPNAAKFMYNSKWNDKLSFKDLIEITSNFTVQQLLERDMFQKRLKKQKPIHLHEFLYPVAQGYDSVSMNVDLEIGGSDQLFNMLAGRTLMKALKNKEKFVLTTKLLADKEGEKVGKTTGNALFLDSTPDNFYGGIMAFPDNAIELGFELLTEINLKGLAAKIKKDPMTEKKRLAFEVVKFLWGENSAKRAQEGFEQAFQKRKIPEKLHISYVTETTPTSLATIAASDVVDLSNSEIKRLISQGAVEINQKVVTDPSKRIKIPKGGVVIKVGKHKFDRIKRK
jgi:tyrosyl-tRNA synthetase